MSSLKNIDEILGQIPYDEELEKAVLGQMILEKNGLISVIDTLKADVFYSIPHQEIFSVIHELYGTGNAVDLITVVHRLKIKGKLGTDERLTPFYIASLTSKIGSSANIQDHAKILLELYMKRQAITLSYKTAKSASDPSKDAFDIIDSLQKETTDIYDIVLKNIEQLPHKMVADYLKQVQNAINNNGEILGIPSGIDDLDKKTNGWQDSNLILVGARPAMGKTGFLLTNVRNAILIKKEPILVFSLEMSAKELIGRLIAMQTGISSFQALQGRVDENYFNAANSFVNTLYLGDRPLLIVDDSASLSIFDIKARAKRYAERYGIKAIFLDYIQLAVRSSATQEQVKRELSIIGKGLKELAKDLNIPVIALSQLNRDVEKTPSKRPELMHLRDSGTLEEDADQVLFLYRKEYYYHLTQKPEFKEIEKDGQIIDSEGIGEIIIAKYRNGSVGSVFSQYVSHTTEWKSFYDNGDVMPTSATPTTGYDAGENPYSNKIFKNISSQDDEPPF